MFVSIGMYRKLMYGVKFSLWLTGAVGPQAVAGRHSSTRPLAGGRLGSMYTITTGSGLPST